MFRVDVVRFALDGRAYAWRPSYVAELCAASGALSASCTDGTCLHLWTGGPGDMGAAIQTLVRQIDNATLDHWIASGLGGDVGDMVRGELLGRQKTDQR